MGELMIENIPSDLLEPVLDAIPLDITFVDSDDTVRYFNRGSDRIFPRTPSVIGRKVQDCHPKKSQTSSA